VAKALAQASGSAVIAAKADQATNANRGKVRGAMRVSSGGTARVTNGEVATVTPKGQVINLESVGFELSLSLIMDTTIGYIVPERNGNNAIGNLVRDLNPRPMAEDPGRLCRSGAPSGVPFSPAAGVLLVTECLTCAWQSPSRLQRGRGSA